MESYEPIFRAFDENKLQYLIVGGLAVNLHGYPRYTNDIDILLALDHENLEKMSTLMKEMDYQQRLPISIQELEDEQKARKFIDEKGLTAYSFIHNTEPQFSVDVLVGASMQFDTFKKETMEAEVWGIRVPVVSIDDLIDMKKESNREKDIQDVAALLELKGL